MASRAASMASRWRVGPTPTPGRGAPPAAAAAAGPAGRCRPSAEVVAGIDHALGHLGERVVDRPGADDVGGHEREGQVVVLAGRLGLQLLDDQALVQPAVGGDAVVRLEHRDGGGGAGVGVAGQGRDAGGRRVGVDGADLAAGHHRDAPHRLTLEAQHPPRAAGAGRLVPVVLDLAALDEEHPLGRAPLAGGQPQPVEVRLPHRLVLAGVEEHRRGDEGHGLLLGRALVRLDTDEPVAQQGLQTHQRQPLLGRGLGRRRPPPPPPGRSRPRPRWNRRPGPAASRAASTWTRSRRGS